MILDELIRELRDFTFLSDEVVILIGNKKYKLSQVYLESYSDDSYKVVIEGSE